MPSKEELKMLQALPLEVKVLKTQQRIREWVTHFGVDSVYVSFSGGKDSTVLLHLVREIYPEVEAVFVNTGLEYPEIQRFVKTFDNVRILYPEMSFKKVICEYGYPVIGKKQSENVCRGRMNIKNGKYSHRLSVLGVSEEEAENLGLTMPPAEMIERYKKTNENSKFRTPKYKPLLNSDFIISNRCCDVIKKAPAFNYQKETGKKPIVATMTEESMQRESAWLETGCNAYEAKHSISKPMSFWTEQDVLQYIKENNIEIASVYGFIANDYEGQLAFDDCGCKLCTTGCDRTGCIFCGFGAHLEKGEGRFQRLKRTHPKQYDFCINGGAYDSDGIWKPDNRGLGMGHVFDELNKLYGDDFIRYK